MSSHRFFIKPAELIPYTRMTHLMISKYHSCLHILFINRCAPSNPLGRNSFSRRGRPPCLPVVFVIHLPLFAVVVIHLPCVRLLRRADTGACPYVWMRLLGGQTQESAPTCGSFRLSFSLLSFLYLIAFVLLKQYSRYSRKLTSFCNFS